MNVSPQPSTRPLVATTDRCRVVVGTRFCLTSGPCEGLVSVEEGAVRLTREADDASALVIAGE